MGKPEAGDALAIEALSGAALGAAAGWVACRATAAIDHYGTEVLISLALVTGTRAVAPWLHPSGRIAVVVSGLLIGNRGPHDAMSEQIQRYLFGFWTLLDEVLDSVLFLLIGLETLVLRFEAGFAWLAAAAVPLALLERLLAVSGPVLAPRRCGALAFAPGTIGC